MKVTVIIPTHNNEHTLGWAIRSAMAQSMPKDQYEVVVVDDGSDKDNTRTVIKTFGNDVKPILFNDNRGLSAALNAAILSTDSQYIARLDADGDSYRPHFLLMMTEYLEYNKQYDWVKCDHFVVDDRENILRRCSEDLACCMLFRRRAIEAVGMYDEEKRKNETLDLLLRLLQDPRFKDRGAHLPVPLYKWFQHPGSLTDGGKMGKV